MSEQPSPIAMQWFPLFFVALWLGICGLFAFVSGWRSLATQFIARARPEGKRFRFVSGSMGLRWLPVRYNNCLSVTVAPAAMHLSILFPFRFLSPPLLIPWGDVETIERRRLFFFTYHVLTLKRQWPRISLFGRAGTAVQQAFAAAGNRVATRC